MKFIAVYRDPKKKNLQRLEVMVMVLALPVALVWGARSYADWSAFQQAEALFHQGDAHLHAGRSDEAVVSLEKAVGVYPEFYGAWESLGTAWHMMNNHEKELDAYKRGVASLPQSGELHRELGAAYHELGEHKKELEHLTTAQTILGKDEIFTTRLLDRATREAAGTYPKSEPKIARASEAAHDGHDRAPGQEHSPEPEHSHSPGDGHEHSHDDGHGHPPTTTATP